MKDGVAIDFDSSGENNITRGMPPKYFTSIEFYKNGLPCFISRRNHLHVLRQPYDFPWYVTNNDTKQLLINSTGTETLQ